MIPVIGFVGYSDSGKTTLAAKVIQILHARGKRVAIIKHDAHGHYTEAEEKDSGKYVAAGADAVMVVSPQSFVRIERRMIAGLHEVLEGIRGYDVILVEGYKAEAHPKIAVFRNEEQEAIVTNSKGLIAVATTLPYRSEHIPVFDLDDALSVSLFIEDQIAKQMKRGKTSNDLF